MTHYRFTVEDGSPDDTPVDLPLDQVKTVPEGHLVFYSSRHHIAVLYEAGYWGPLRFMVSERNPD